MLPIYSVPDARASILKRRMVGERAYPERLLAGVERIFGKGVTPEEAVKRILESVRSEGDEALRRWSEKIDGVKLDSFRVPPSSFAEAMDSLPPRLIEALRTAAERIRSFHRRQPIPSWEENGLGQRFTPVERVGVYVPGGSAPLPSSLLMSVIPAQVAGVEEIIVCTPPEPHPAILAAAAICGVESVYRLGGAQAIAAMAFGTESLPKVDKIVGAGNVFVTLAKKQVYGLVGLDGLAGPTETMVIADATANPDWVAADLLAQAEHDPLATAILLTPDLALAKAVQRAVERQISALSRREIIRQSLESNGGIVLVRDLDEAARLADEFAPEHLCLSVAEPRLLMDRIRNAGGFFLGEYSFEVLGDYAAGPSHVMPTSGTARFASPLNVYDFLKISSVIGLEPGLARELSAVAAEIAHAEGLTAHAAAAEMRLGGAPSPTE